MSGSLSDAGNRIRRSERSRIRSEQGESVATQLRAARRAQHPASHDLSRASCEQEAAGRRDVSVGDRIADLVLERRSRWPWFVGFTLGLACMLAFCFACGVLFWKGVGIWGVDMPVAWGYAIANFDAPDAH